MPDKKQKSMIDEGIDLVKSIAKSIAKLFKPIVKAFSKDVKEE